MKLWSPKEQHLRKHVRTPEITCIAALMPRAARLIIARCTESVACAADMYALTDWNSLPADCDHSLLPAATV
jgi:hypothetical protein